jgi:putative ATP-binding cassette transporter
MSTANGRMNIFSLLFRRAPNRVFLSILLDAMSGVAYAMIIPLVLKSIDAGIDSFASEDAGVVTFLGLEVSNHWYAAMFAAAVVFILATKTTSRILRSCASACTSGWCMRRWPRWRRPGRAG